MARSLASKTNVIAPAGAFPYGRIKDDTGTGDGTPVDEEVYGDFHQFFARLLNDAGIAANGTPENSTNGFQYNDALSNIIRQRIYGNQSGAWTAGAGVTVGANLGASVSVGTIANNRYHALGKTYQLAIRLTNITITGSPTELTIDILPNTGAGWKDPGAVLAGVIYTGATPCSARLSATDTAIIIRRLDGNNFSAGSGFYIDINLTAELA